MSPNDSNISSTWQTAAWPAIQATIFTWAVTAAGSALVFVLPAEQTTFQKQLLDSLLGFAAGVMTAAAFFSLLAPAIAFASEASSMWHFCPALPVAMGFGLGGGFLFYTDLWLERNGLEGAGSLEIMLHGCLPPASLRVKSKSSSDGTGKSQSLTPPGSPAMSKRDSLTRRGGTSKAGIASPGLLVRGKSFDMEVGGELSREKVEDDDAKGMQKGVGGSGTSARWRRMWLLIIASKARHDPPDCVVCSLSLHYLKVLPNGFNFLSALLCFADVDIVIARTFGAHQSRCTTFRRVSPSAWALAQLENVTVPMRLWRQIRM